MQDMTQEVNNLVDRVHLAFLNVPNPVDQSGVKISYSNDTERKDLAAFLNGKHWTSVTYETLVANYHHQRDVILFFLTRDGFHYYYPAFLLMSLNLRNAGVDDQLAESAFVPFDRLSSGEDSGFFQDRVARFSLEQLRSIEAIFKFIWEERQRKYAVEFVRNCAKLVALDMEVLQNALEGVRQEIAAKSALT